MRRITSPGIVFLYQDLKVPVCPLALNSGMFWPRRSFLRYPGTIVVEFLDPIPPGFPARLSWTSCNPPSKALRPPLP